ncbi:MAG: TonB-dependent receptor, partial [Paludibacteraceae bacterium]|nr:TonB-dependent receptor [Paludibacteraceae bacterium]
LDVAAGKTVVISYVGYRTQELRVSEKQESYNTRLEEDSEVLEDVVVIGYGTQKRSDVTGSISSVKAEDLADFSSKSLAESLSGMAAGVSVTKGSGAPGEAADILIRGAGSLNGMAPLYVVDGVAQDAGFNFNMRDVESIEILKDAGSAAIYGSKAAGGVILITTKKGRAERTQVDLNARVGWRNVSSNIHLLGTADWIRARDAWGTGSTLTTLGVQSVDDLPDTDWMKVMFGTGIEQEYNLSVSSGTEKTKFFISLGFLDEKGTYMDTRATRYSLRANIDHKMNKYVSFGTNIYGAMTSTNPATSSSIYNHTIPFRTVPVAEVMDADGNYAMTPVSVASGPNFAGMEAAYHAINDKNYYANAQAYLNVEFMPGLTWRTTGSAAIGAYSKRYFTEYKDFGPVQVGVDGGQLDSYAGTNLRLMFNSVLTYDQKWGNHGFRAMVGTEWWKYDGYDLNVHTYNFPLPGAESIALGSAGATKDASDGIPQERRGSAFARINYDYGGRYLLAANFRADASDRFVKKNRWGFFPSVNAGWRISEEPWVKEPAGDWLSNMKVRASWGILGNDNIPQYMYQSIYSLSGISRAFNESAVGQTGAWIAILGNENLKWEEVNQVDVGLDMGFFNNRLTVTYDYYNRQTRDMLYQGSLNLSSGMSYYFASNDPANTVPVYFNAGLVENSGHEVSIQWQDRKSDFSYQIGLNMSFNRNLVKQVGDQPGATTIDKGLDASWPLLSRTEDGYAMSMYYGYKVLGIFQTQEQVDYYNNYALDKWKQANDPDGTLFSYNPSNGQPLNPNGKDKGIYYQNVNAGVGDLIYDDNGQGSVTAASRQYIGNPWPVMTMGLNMSFACKGVDLSLVFAGAFGFDIMNLVKPYTHMFMSDNTTADIFNTSCFGGTNVVTADPRVGFLNNKGKYIGDGAANRNYSQVSGYMVEKGDYLKLKNLSVGYTLPQKYSRKAKMEKLRIYFSAQNLFTITGYTGIDPEIGGNSLMYNIDHQNRYLPSRLYSFGLDLSF